MDSTNRNTALASVFCEELARAGVTRAVICPGSRSTPLALALLREPAIVTTSIVDERSAGFFAIGAAAATRRPVAIVCTSGTATANLHPAVAEAHESSLPLLVLTSDRPPELRAVGAGQTIDQVKLYGSAVRWFCEVGTHEADDAGLVHMRSLACRAAETAAGEPRPGPVHLNFSWRDPLGPEPVAGAVQATASLALEGRGDDLPLTGVHRPLAELADRELDQLAADLAETSRGLIVAGRSTHPGLAPALAELARACGFPILAEPTSQLRFGRHSRAAVVWAYDAVLNEAPEALRPDVVIRFGDMPTSKRLRTWLGGLDRCLQLVVDPWGTWNEPTRKAALTLRSEPVALARSLAGRLAADDLSPDFERGWLAAADATQRAIRTGVSGLSELSEPGVHTALADAYQDGELIFTASSMPIRDQEAFAAGSDRDVLFMANRGANGIDGTISSGVGAAVAAGRPTWIVLGDLALHHDSNGLALVRDAGPPIRIICLNNGGGGIFEFLPQADQVSRQEFEAIFGTPLETDISSLAAAHGIEYRRIGSAADLTDPPESHILFEVPVDRRANVALHADLLRKGSEAAAQALAGAG